MTEAGLDRLLAVLLAAILATGLVTLRAGTPETQWVYVIHGLLSGVLLAAVGLKVWRSMPRAVARRRWGHLALGVLLAIAALLSLGVGFLWVAGGRFVEIGPWTLLSWHSNVGLALTVLVTIHLLIRGRWRVLRPRWLVAAGPAHGGRQVGRRLSRRSFVVGGGLAITGVLVWGTAELLDRLGGAPRRFTGSRWLPSGGVPTPTTFLGEGTPAIDPTMWRLRVTGDVERPLGFDLPALQALGVVDQTHVLDCTGGWAMETTWRGVPLTRLLDVARVRPGARTVSVISVTGWSTALPLDEARSTMLATAVAGVDLPAANGAPCRLVVPSRRGVDWVKWVSEVRVA